jgi:ABC-2 type transport system permease protein
MATQATSHPVITTGTTFSIMPALSLWRREVVRFYRNKSRVVGIVASPLVFWIFLGAGFGSSFHSPTAGNGQSYLDYFFPGSLMMIVLFTSIFAMMSLIEDRNEGFLLSVLVAPVHRSVIVLGKVLGGTTLAMLQGVIFLALAPLIGIHFGLLSLLWMIVDIFLVSFALTALGFIIAWPMDSTAAFHGIINLFLIPLWMLSGSMFPVSSASPWMAFLMRLNPLTYGTEALRGLLFPAIPSPEFPLVKCLSVLVVFTVILFSLAFVVANRRSTKPAA